MKREHIPLKNIYVCLRGEYTKIMFNSAFISADPFLWRIKIFGSDANIVNEDNIRKISLKIETEDNKIYEVKGEIFKMKSTEIQVLVDTKDVKSL